jgi:predicted nucleic acid-binding protein
VILYADASGLVKRYLAEAGSELVAGWLDDAERVACCRIGYVEAYRAIMLAGLEDAADTIQAFERDWSLLDVVEIDDGLSRRAGVLAAGLGVRSLDALHLAGAELLTGPDLRIMTWDRRLWRAARILGMAVLPEAEP